MVAFGKKLKERSIQEWQGYYINYKLMKKKVNQYGRQLQGGNLERRQVLKDFSKMLDNQIEKVALFMLEQQGILASRLQRLRESHDALQEEPEISHIAYLKEGYRAVGQDLLKLLFFVEMNAIGVRKILKKFDKRFGYRFTNYYVKTRANHPYSELQQVYKHVGLGAVVGAVSRNLHELQNNQGSYLSIYDQPVLPLQDPVVDSIKAAVDRLTHSTNFLNFMAQHAFIMQQELPSPQDEEEAVEEDRRYHFMSLLLNLVNTFLYMVNTYIIVPTADDYSMSLGAAATVCGVVIGAMAVAQLFSSVYFSAWSNKSYFKPLIFSSIVLFIGNLLYALAFDFNSIAVLLIGRLFCGLGSARAVNRRYISDCVPLKIRMQASAGFVSASALGMACGPALAGLLQTRFKIYKLTFNQNTLPGWVMAVAWLMYLVWLAISFRELALEPEESHSTSKDSNNSEAVQDGNLESGIKQPLLITDTQRERRKTPNNYSDFPRKRTMERATLSPSLNQSYLLSPSRASTTRLHSFSFTRNLSPSTSSIKLQPSSSSVSSSFINGGVSLTRCNAVLSNSSSSTDASEVADIDWDNIGFGLKPTDYMYVMKCNLGGEFSNGELQRFGNIEVSPSAGVLNYGQGLFEGMKAYRKQDGKNILLFRPEENATRMRCGAERMCMPAPTIDQFVEAVKATVLANKRWVPPPGKGSLYIRPLLMGTGAVLGLAPAPEYTFLVYVSPVGNYFKEGVSPINLIVESEFHRATPGGTGGVKTIGNYAAVLKAQSVAKAKGYSDVLYLDCIYKRYLEEVSSCNIFIVKDNVVSTPEIRGTILPGITRKSIVDVARSQGLKVEERNVTVDELLEADEVFCTGTAVVVSPVGSITYKGKRVSYGEGSFGPVSEKLYTVLTSLQMGLTEDNMKWTVNLS